MLAAPIVIIGSGLAGYAVAREVRKLDKSVRIVIITKERGDYYSKPALSTAFAQKKAAADLVTTTADEMRAQLDVTLLAETEVSSLDLEERRVCTSSGDIEYGKLVLALGADPIALPILGSGAADVQAVNDLADYSAFRGRLSEGKRVLIIGAGLIGCEFANDLLHAGVTPIVVDRNASPLASLIPASAGTVLRDRLAAAGVQWRLGASVTAVERIDTGYRAVLNLGEAVDVDLVLSAVGLRPRTQLARAAGLDVNRGIVVDAFAQTSAPDVFALGDCAEYESGVLPFVQPIMVAARQLAQTLIGSRSAIRFPHMPVIVKTPAHPVVVHKPPPSVQGDWQFEESETGMVLWYKDTLGAIHGFVLTGEATGGRMAATRQLSA
jgi:rubredoxin---NAD+ reductase